MKRLITIILALTIACQSLSLNIFANSAEIADILRSVTGETEAADENCEEIIDDDAGIIGGEDSNIQEDDDISSDEISQSYDESTEDDCGCVPDNDDDSAVITDTVINRISALLDIDAVSAQNMVEAYGGENEAMYEAENYAQLREIFYALGYSDVKDKFIALVINGYGAQRVACSGIVAIALQADINDVIIKDGEQVFDEDIYVENFAQQFYVSPEFVKNYAADTRLTTETVYSMVISLLQAMYPNAYPASTLSDDPNEKKPEYPNSAFYVNSGENESISPVSGALTYVMNLATIPGVNGMDIDLTLRYDSDRSVAQGEYKVTGGGQGYSDGSSDQYINHYYEPFIWQNKSPFMFGTGWRLNYDYIYKRDDKLLLVLSDGREYEINGTAPNYSLKGYNSASLTLLGINEGDAKYKLTFIDGTVEKFNRNGELLSKTDRYGNSLTFTHQKISIPVGEVGSSGTYTDRLVITDSHSTVYIDYNFINQRIVLPDGNTILLSYSYRNNDYLLMGFTNQAGESTSFSYQSELCGLNNYSYCTYSDGSINRYYYNYQKLYYNYLTRISYPTGASTVYTYTKPESDTYVTWLISGREDNSYGAKYNKVSYSFNLESRQSSADYGKKTIEYTYDSNGLVTQETTKEGDKVKGWLRKSYNKDLGLPTYVLTAFASPMYGDITGYGTWNDGQGHGGYYPIYDTTSYCTKADTYQYDSVGKITKQVVDGITTTNTYDSRYHLLKQSVSCGDDGKTVKTVNTLSSDGKSILSSSVYDNNTLSGKTAYTYDSHGNPTLIKKYRSANTSVNTNNVYSSDGRILSSTTSDVTVSYTYDQMGRVLSETDGMGCVTSYGYDALGRVISETYPNNAVKTYSYTVGSGINKTVVTDELGFETTYNYNGLGKIISVYSEDQCLETTAYDLYYRVSSKTDANGATTNYSYDYADRPTSVTVQDTAYKETYSYEWDHTTCKQKTRKTVIGSGVPNITTVSYNDVYGRDVSDGVVLGNSEWLSIYTYDSFGNKVSELTFKDSNSGLSFTNKYTYDINGNVTSVCNALNQYTYAEYDWLGNMLSETDLSGNKTTYTYDDFGRVLTKTTPVDTNKKLIITNSYDKNGNLIKEVVSGDGGVNKPSIEIPLDPVLPKLETMQFDPSNNQDTDKTTSYTYDNRNNLLSVRTYTSSDNSFVTAAYTYDAKGQMLTSTSGQYTTSYSYDARGNVASITYPGGGVETFVYNAANNVVSSTDRNGVTTTYTYNVMGKPVSISAGGKTKSYTYASTGGVLTETSDDGTTSYTYDYMGRVVSETSGSTTTSYTYDSASNILTITVNGTTTGYTYDDLNRLTRTVNGSNIVDYVYDTAGRRTGTTVNKGNSIVSKTLYTYDVAGNITALRNLRSNGALLSEFIYTYDAEGNALTEYDSTTGKTTNYRYDILGRLVSEIGGGTSRYYTYDAAGNRIKAIIDTANTIQYTYDSDGRLTSETASNGQTSTVTTYAYDANGNLIKKKEGTKSTTYTFDVWGNMTSGAGASYTYNVQGLRTSKTVGNKSTNFTLVGGKVWSDGTYNYVWGAELITNGSVYYLYNAHGDVVQLVNASGIVTKTYDYEAYGNELTRDAADSNPFRYCGEYYDNETGFIYLRARYYDPMVGRFISQDPVKDGLNWYAYCNNNPVLFVDENGLWPSWSQIGAAVLTIAVAIVAITAVVASAGTAGAAIGIGASMALGVSGATAAAFTTGATIGCYGVAAGIGLCAAGDVDEIFTDHNFVRDDFMGGNQEVYDFTKTMLYAGAACITTLAAELNPTIPQENDYPPNNGAVSGTEKTITLKAGSVYGRYGGIYNKSRYMTDYGADPDILSLPYNTNTSIYNTIIVKKDIENVVQSTIAPWYGSSGGGIQYMLPETINELIAKGYIEVR